MNCVLTFISGDKFSERPEVGIYLNSLGLVSGDKFVFTHDLNVVNRDRIARFGITIIDVDNIQWILRDRHRVYAEFLSSCQYQRVLITDSKDVLFTSDPFTYETSEMLLVSEGITHGQSLWNTLDQTRLQQMIKPEVPFEHWPVINGGVQFGSSSAVRTFCDIIYKVMLQTRLDCTDQALINYMYYVHWQQDHVYTVADPHTDWFCCTGDPISRNIHGYPLDIATWRNPNLSRSYAVVHQWERVALS